MSDEKATPKKRFKIDVTAHQPTAGNPRTVAKSALDIQKSIPKDTISNALRAALENHERVTDAAKQLSVPSIAIGKAVEAALQPSRSIQAAVDTVLNSPIQKAMRTIPTIDLLGPHSSTAPTKPAKRLDMDNAQTNMHRLDKVSELGSAVRNARKSMGLTQQEFADLAGVGRRFVFDLERGKQTLEIGKALKVAAAAGIKLALISADTNS